MASQRAKSRYQSASPNSVESINFEMLNELLYTGRQDRLQKYAVYDMMDKDVDVSRALDIIAEHCSQKDDKSETPFHIHVDNAELGNEDSETLFEMLKIWNKLNKWDNFAYRAVRNCIKYGDMFFIRDKDFRLFPLHPSNVEGIYADEDTGEVQAYRVTGLKRKFDCLHNAQEQSLSGSNPTMYQRGVNTMSSQKGGGYKTYTGIISKDDMFHISLNEGVEVGGNGEADAVWPFGESILEKIYKDFKSRSLLEDAELIHRIQRAPSRRVFYIDVGKQRQDKAEAFMRKVKNELQQKRVASSHGGRDGVDTIYNPISQMEDLFLAQNSDGKGHKVENLEGQAWSNPEILQYFNSKLLRGLRVPVSFMLGPEEGGATYNDGRTGVAYMQEIEFSRSCERIQHLIDNDFDFEFKMFLMYRGVDVHNGYFNVQFVPPMNFDEHRNRSLNDERLATLSTALSIPFIAKRVALRKYGSWTEDEILENEHEWMEENRPAAARQHNQDNSLGGMGVGMGSFNNSFGGLGDPMGGGMDGMGAPGMGGMEAGGMGGGAGGMGGAAGGAPGASPAGFESTYFQMSNPMLMEEYKRLRRMAMYSEGFHQEEALKSMVLVESIITERQELIEREQSPQHVNIVMPRLVDRRRLVEDILDDAEDSTTDEDGAIQKPKEPITNDEGWAKKAEGNSKTPVMTLAHVRKLRLIREKNRKELIKRMLLLQQMYAAPAEPGGMGF